MALQTDLPDFHASRQVTDDPIIAINQAVNVTPYDSGILDTGQFTRLHVAATANGPNGIFTLKVTFHPTSTGATNAFQDIVTINKQGVWYNADYPMATRYVQFTLSEVTATGDLVILQVSPASGPSTLFTFTQVLPPPTFGTIGAGVTLTYDPTAIVRGLWRIYAFSRTPKWSLSAIGRDVSGVGTTLLTLNNALATLPIDITVRLETANIYLSFTNNWVNQVALYLYMSPVGL